MTQLDIFALSALTILAYKNLLFLLAIALKKNDIVDVAWGLGFVMITILTQTLLPEQGLRRNILSILVILWGLRLAIYIFIRNRGRQEDFRYAQWRKDWGKGWMLRSWLQVFMLQGFFMFVISYPLMLNGAWVKDNLTLLDFIGILIWLIGFFFEAVGDAQMRRFKLDPANRGKIMKSGLWRYTRHPNYFGESCMWWGIFFIMLNHPAGAFAVISPLTMTWLLTKVSGVPMLEKKYTDNPEYAEYISKTSSFFPRRPKP